jgi:hypothetical protein
MKIGGGNTTGVAPIAPPRLVQCNPHCLYDEDLLDYRFVELAYITSLYVLD